MTGIELNPTSRLLIEPASPFVASTTDTFRIEPERADPPLVVDLLSAPERVVDRLVDSERLEATVVGSLVTIAAGTSLFALVMMLPVGWLVGVRSGVLAAFNALIALAAALGPIYSASLLLGSRLPLARLVGTLLSAAATGAMMLAALAPVPYFLWKADSEWAGPLAVVACFALSGLAAGGRIQRTLVLLAERIKQSRGTESLDPAELHRVGILSRIALMVFALTSALAMWGFDALAGI